METFAVMAEFERQVARLLKEKNLGRLDALKTALFASHDPDWDDPKPKQSASLPTSINSTNAPRDSPTLRHPVRTLPPEVTRS
jgi:hypothetical protein